MFQFICTLVLAIGVAADYLPTRAHYPQVISHRGASGYVPEHSIGAYQLAVDLHTDYVEPDLCLSKDGVFVVIHDVLLDDTTDVASHPEFADRKTTKTVDGVTQTGYFVSDFLYSELATLRLKQRMSGRTTIYNGYFPMQKFADVLQFAKNNYAKTGRMVGVYAELKHPGFFNTLGFPSRMEDMFLEILESNGYATKGEHAYNDLSVVVPLVIQCFDPRSLEYLNDKTSLAKILLLEYPSVSVSTHPTLQAVSRDDLLNISFLKEISKFSAGIGPNKEYFAGELAVSKAIMNNAHSLGLFVHPWTFRADSSILPQFHNDFEAEEAYFYGCLGMDGVFTEFADRTRETIDLIASNNKRNYCEISSI